MSDISDLSGPEEDDTKKRKESKGLIGKKEKKRQKEKETRYAHLADDSSGEDEIEGKSPAKSKLTKPFMFGSARKDKDKKKECKEAEGAGLNSSASLSGSVSGPMANSAATAATTSSVTKDKKKEKKEKKETKTKLKLKKSKAPESDSDNGKGRNQSEDCPIFGVPLEVAVERNRCHDGIPLPMVVRQCIDYIEENGLMMEGVYRSSGVKSKVNKLRAAFNSREADQIRLSDYEPAVVASVLKQFLRELPDTVLTNQLMLRFEEVSALNHPQKRIEGMKILIAELPECNRALLQWIFVHMKHVIERERFNKMTLQNVSIVLSPTMRISHRVLNCLFENSHILFDGIQLKKYVPPITTSGAVKLPESPDAIEEEIKKQESLLADLHLQISSGAASKKTEEQIWEQQRIVTQLKRKLRTAKKEPLSAGDPPQPRYEPIDYEEDLDFSLQTSHLQESPIKSSMAVQVTDSSVNEIAQHPQQIPHSSQPVPFIRKEASQDVTDSQDIDHKVTVMVHRADNAHQSGQSLQTNQQIQQALVQTSEDVHALPASQSSGISEVSAGPVIGESQTNETELPTKRSTGHVTVIRLGSNQDNSQVDVPVVEKQAEKVSPVFSTPDSAFKVSKPIPSMSTNPVVTTSSSTSSSGTNSVSGIPLLPPPPGSHKSRNSGHVQILRPVPASPMPKTTLPPATSTTNTVATSPGQTSAVFAPVNVVQSTGLKVDSASVMAKSKSLPRGLPSDGSAFNTFDGQGVGSNIMSVSMTTSNSKVNNTSKHSHSMAMRESREITMEDLHWEALRLQFEYEELVALKSELEHRKRSERNEMEELREEIATMQTLYQYRTYSVDSSESSSDDNSDKDVREEVEELTKVLSDLVRENRELEEKRLELCHKIEEERALCVNLRVQIRLEQERIQRRRTHGKI